MNPGERSNLHVSVLETKLVTAQALLLNLLKAGAVTPLLHDEIARHLANSGVVRRVEDTDIMDVEARIIDGDSDELVEGFESNAQPATQGASNPLS